MVIHISLLAVDLGAPARQGTASRLEFGNDLKHCDSSSLLVACFSPRSHECHIPSSLETVAAAPQMRSRMQGLGCGASGLMWNHRLKSHATPEHYKIFGQPDMQFADSAPQVLKMKMSGSDAVFRQDLPHQVAILEDNTTPKFRGLHGRRSQLYPEAPRLKHYRGSNRKREREREREKERARVSERLCRQQPAAEGVRHSSSRGLRSLSCAKSLYDHIHIFPSQADKPNSQETSLLFGNFSL